MTLSIDIKKRLFQACLDLLGERVAQYEKAIQSAEEAAANETKSSAGDKYETGRAMMHLEKEKNQSQLQQVLTLKSRLKQISIEKSFSEVGTGTLVRTSIGHLFFLESIGKVILDGEKFQVISIQSPIGKILRGKKAEEKVSFNGRAIEVFEIV